MGWSASSMYWQKETAIMDNDLLIFWGLLPWLFFLIIILKANKRNCQNLNTYKQLFLFVLLFTSIRYGVGFDYFTYKDIIEGNAPDYSLERWEILPQYLAKVCRKIHYQLFFAITSFLFLYPVYYVIKKEANNPILALSIFLLFPSLYLNSIGVIRNSVAYSFVFLAFYYLKSGFLIRSIVSVVIAICFHLSAFIAILIYPLYFYFHKRSHLFVCYIVSLFASSIVLHTFGNLFSGFFLYDKFVNNIDKNLGGGGIFYYIFNILSIINLLYWKKIEQVSSDTKYYLSCVVLGVCLWNSFLALDSATASRLSTFFVSFIVFLFPAYIPSLRFSKSSILSLCISLYVASFILNLHAHYILHRSMANLPYQIFFLYPSDVFYH